ncbi:MAG TPA: hypothetical protein VI216_05125 [Candidatus Acidoferrales bacterium]
MKILKLILGGLVALTSAFGTTLAVLFILMMAEARNQKATGLGAAAGDATMMLHSAWFWLAVFVSFAIGFFLTYRKLYF